MKIFTVHDAKAEYYMQPFFARNSGEAIRSFSEAINGDSNHQFAKYPADFTLFLLGEFNTDTGEITAHPSKSLGNGVDFKQQQ